MSRTTVQIRPELPQDAVGISRVTTAAFKAMPYSDQTEAAIIDALRADGQLTLSLVAGDGAEIIGHAAFSPVRINGAVSGWFGLGPVSVTPDRQGEGVGEALIQEGLARLRARGAEGCVVLGAPAYYGRFGFQSDAALRYRPAPAGHFQRLVFLGPAPRGEVTYHPSFEGPSRT